MPATPTAPEIPAQPGPPQDPPPVSAGANPGATPRVGRLLGLVRWIITYGQQLAVSLQQHTDPVRFASLAFRFQTTDLAAILARITRGLMLAAGLEGKLERLAEAGRDVQPVDIRLPAERAPRDGRAAPEPRVRPGNIIDLPLDRLPSAEAIAAELRRRPLGAILVDICRDLGIAPGDIPAGHWEELERAIINYDGNLATLMFGCPLHERAMAEARRIIAGGDPADGPAWVIPPLPADAAPVPIGSPDATRKPLAA